MAASRPKAADFEFWVEVFARRTVKPAAGASGPAGGVGLQPLGKSGREACEDRAVGAEQQVVESAGGGAAESWSAAAGW